MVPTGQLWMVQIGRWSKRCYTAHSHFPFDVFSTYQNAPANTSETVMDWTSGRFCFPYTPVPWEVLPHNAKHQKNPATKMVWNSAGRDAGQSLTFMSSEISLTALFWQIEADFFYLF